ncbi:MAG: biotin/lipoyl-binding protein [Caldilineaceae bacterium]|nr:biotin/lipoyl-binding protein [Caldilineaceae bacterium]
MKYFATVDGVEYEVLIEQDRVLVDGEPVDVDLKQGGVSELYSLLFNGASFEILIEAQRFNYDVTLQGEHFQVQVEDERTRKLNTGRKVPNVPHGELSINAPIPGLVVKVLVGPGDAVQEEQPVAILEAMKMENEIRALRSGTVKQVNITPGQRVEQNAPLVILE